MTDTNEDLNAALPGLDVDPDAYAETAAGDIPSVSRTFQSEDAFQAIKSSYTAKQGSGNNLAELLEIIPTLKASASGSDVLGGGERPKLAKKEQQLLGYAVGEMYYQHQFTDVVSLCESVERQFACDAKLLAALQRWRTRCEGRLGRDDNT